MNAERITYQTATSQGRCLLCGKPAKSDKLGAPYCSKCELELEQRMQQAQREHPERFRW